MVHPCCTVVSLQTASKIVAIIDAVGGMFGAVTTGMVAIALIFFRQEIQTELDANNAGDTYEPNLELQRFMEQPEAIQYSMIGTALVICILEIIVAALLFKGARARNSLKCTIWFRVHLVLFFLGTMFTVVAIITATEKISISIAGGVGMIYQMYTLWIVKAFVNELDYGRHGRSRSFGLEDEQGEPLQVIRKS